MTEDERVSRFEAAYNRIDRALNGLLDERKGLHRTFSTKVRLASNRYRRLRRYADFLLEVAELRNALVHNRTDQHRYMAVPHADTVAELEQVERKMFSPEKVVPRFQRPVTTVAPEQTLADVLQLIRDEGFARYPVYGGEGFVGLLTTNGLARWWAGRIDGDRFEIDASAVSVDELISVETHRDRVAFVSRNAFVEEIEDLFTDRAELDAVIITERGKRHERPLGMICARDVVGEN